MYAVSYLIYVDVARKSRAKPLGALAYGCPKEL
jgi:hypothetical protein